MKMAWVEWENLRGLNVSVSLLKDIWPQVMPKICRQPQDMAVWL